jgi:hypothetical protein
LIHVYSVTATPVIMTEPTTLTPSGVPIMTPPQKSQRLLRRPVKSDATS